MRHWGLELMDAARSGWRSIADLGTWAVADSVRNPEVPTCRQPLDSSRSAKNSNDAPARHAADDGASGRFSSMTARKQARWIVGSAALICVAGCHEPKNIVPVAPPGLELQRTPVGPQTEAQAIGEQRVAEAQQKSVKVAAGNTSSPPTPVGQSTKKSSGLEYVTLKEGEGTPAKSGQTVTMHYVGTLDDGTKFDSSRDSGQPFQTRIGVGEVIPGWDEGVPGMKIGEQRKLIIPADLGYGARGMPPKIPGGATLTFVVELLGVQ